MVLQLINRIFKKMFSSFAQLQEFQFSNHPLRLLTDKSEVGIFLNHLDDVYYPKPPDPGSSAASSKSKSSKEEPFTPWDVVVEKISHHKEDGDTDTRHEYLRVDLFCRRKSKQVKGYVIIDRAKKAAKPAKDPKDPKKAGKSNKSDDDGALTSDTAGAPSDAEAPLLPSSSRSPLSPAVASSGEETPVSPQLVSPALSEVSTPTQAPNTSEVKRAKRGILMGSFTESAEGSAARSVGVVHDSVVSLELVEPSHARDKIRWYYNPSGGLFGKRYVEVQTVTFNERSLENQGTFQHSDEEWEKLKQEGAKAEQAYRQRGAYKYRRLNLHQLVSLASFLHDQQSKYTINGGQCFWYADVLIRLAADRTGAELTPGKHYDQRGKFRTAGIYDSAKWDEEYKYILDKSYDHVSAGRADHDARRAELKAVEAERKAQEERQLREEEQRKREESDRRALEEQREKEEERRQKEEERRQKEEAQRELEEARRQIAELKRLNNSS